MELQSSKNLVEKVFNNSYSRNNFLDLISNLLKSYNKDQKEMIISDDKNQFNSFVYLGSYEESNKELGIYEVEIDNLKTLLNARVAQRNIIAVDLKNKGYDFGLASFYVKDESQWRFSLIKFERSIDISSDKIKFLDIISPSKRQSFIAGNGEGTHTAKKQLLAMLKLNESPSFDDIENIFQIEAVNDDFYEQYKDLYLGLTEYLEDFILKDEVIAKDFTEKEVSPSDFAKKTLGQFIFLYFIQKKGWIKYKDNSDDSFSFSKFFDKRKSYGDNFFNDLMEPIFYESLAKKNPNLALYPNLKNFEFPYLNGGLFEPIRGYDWQKTNIIIPDEFFKNNNKTRDGDIGDGLIDVFNRFNFTVYENDNIDQDIAVDPEMLGKVFENLLNIKDRKSIGAFYTPREIVRYMCKESLISYLVREIGDEISLEILETFVNNHAVLGSSNINDGQLSIIAENAFDLDELLSNIKVCDPAVGSGAFPMGMLNEIVGVRSLLQPFLSNKQTIYDLKFHAISKSLYGVDLDASAVEIARLRFWLSLIIDEETPTPLPNLEHKLMQGNSLLSSYQGMKLFNDKFIENEDARLNQINTINEEKKILENKLIDNVKTNSTSVIQETKKRLISLNRKKTKILKNNQNNIDNQQEIFESQDIITQINKKVSLLQSKISIFLLPDNNKEALKHEIDEIKWKLIELSFNNKDKAENFACLKNKRIQPFFLWKLEFSDVFTENGGFDIVIGNPPYIQLQKRLHDNTKIKLGDLYETSEYATFCRTGDIYALFYELGIKLSRNRGNICLITSNKWMKAAYGNSLRAFLSKYDLNRLIDFSGNKVFANATVDVNILSINNIPSTKNLKATSFKEDFKKISFSEYIKSNEVPLKNISEESWAITDLRHQLIREKIESIGTPLKNWNIKINRGILTGFNGAFIIDKSTRDALIEKDSKSEEILKPVLRGRDIMQYSYNFNNLFLINSHNGYKDKNGKKIKAININNYPAIKKHLDNYWEKIEKRYDKGTTPYNLRNCAYIEEFDEEKIIYPSMTKYRPFILDSNKFYTNDKCFIITGDKLNYLTGILNSWLFDFAFKDKFPNLGSGMELRKVFFEKLLIPQVNDDNRVICEKIGDLAEKITKLNLDNPKLDTSEYKLEIDELIYELYNFSKDEISLLNT